MSISRFRIPSSWYSKNIQFNNYLKYSKSSSIFLKMEELMDGWMSLQILHKLSSCPGLFNPLPTQTHPCWDNTEGTFLKMKMHSFSFWYGMMKWNSGKRRAECIWLYLCMSVRCCEIVHRNVWGVFSGHRMNDTNNCGVRRGGLREGKKLAEDTDSCVG